MRAAFGVIVFAFFAGVIGSANGADSAPQSAFSNAKTVDAAAKDVMYMPRGEIGEFVEYLTLCRRPDCIRQIQVRRIEIDSASD